MNIISAAFIKGINLHTNIQKKIHNHYRVSGGFESLGINLSGDVAFFGDKICSTITREKLRI